MTDVKPGGVAERLERFADAIASDAYNADPWKAEDAASDAPFLRTAASLIRSLSERNEKLEGALSDLLLRLDNKIALAPRIHRAYGHAYVLCAGIEACIKASNARAALERK